MSLTLGWLVAAHAVGQSPEFQEQALSESSFQVGAWASVNVQLVSETEADTEGVVFQARGLPKGLTCDAETGIISGYPVKAGEAKVTLIAKRGKDSASRSVVMTVAAFPELAVGEFQGLLGAEENGWARWGGMVSLKVTAGGKLTGKLMVEKRAYPLKGVLRGDGSGDYEATLKVTSGVTVTVAFYKDTPELYGDLHAEGAESNMSFMAAPPLPARSEEATNVVGTYNIHLSVPSSEGAQRPRGFGFLVAKVGADGRVKLTGKLPDGTTVTASSLLQEKVGVSYPILIHVPLYERRLDRKKSSTGVLQGSLGMYPVNEYHDENTIWTPYDSRLVWQKAAQEGPTDGLYADGFYMSLEAQGYLYRKPTNQALLLDAERGDHNAVLKFYETDSASATWTQGVTLTAGHQAKPVKEQQGWLSKINVKMNGSTGIFSGSFELLMPGPQKVVFAGILSTSLEGSVAQGHFLMRDAPNDVTGAPGAVKSYPVVLETQTPTSYWPTRRGPFMPGGIGAPSGSGSGFGAPVAPGPGSGYGFPVDWGSSVSYGMYSTGTTPSNPTTPNPTTSSSTPSSTGNTTHSSTPSSSSGTTSGSVLSLSGATITHTSGSSLTIGSSFSNGAPLTIVSLQYYSNGALLPLGSSTVSTPTGQDVIEYKNWDD